MNSQSFKDIDGIFEQTLDAIYDGPVPEAVLRRSLLAVELVIRRELVQEQSNRELAGLRIGYIFQEPFNETDRQEPDNETDSQVYWVGWGYHPAYDGILENQLEIFGKTVGYPNDPDQIMNILPDKMARRLLDKLQKEMLRRTPSHSLKGKTIFPFVYGHIVSLACLEPRVLFVIALSCHRYCNGKRAFRASRGKPCRDCI
jgi:hypothetical protein